MHYNTALRAYTSRRIEDPREFFFATDVWIKIVYELAATFHSWSVNRNKLIDLMTPLYYARAASFVRQSWKMSSQEAEELVEGQAQGFELHKDYLITVWDTKLKEVKKKKSGSI